jgi:L-asparaginase
MTLRIITTGGTFDKCYDPLTGQLEFEQGRVPRLLEDARLAPVAVVESLMAMDSLNMRDDHRQAVLAACRASPEQRIVIVHGTDTMVQTAAVLAQADLPATIVLTGAMVPATIEHSDAAFNLGFAIACARCLAAGVWVAMNGEVHAWNRVRKNRVLGVFEALD